MGSATVLLVLACLSSFLSFTRRSSSRGKQRTARPLRIQVERGAAMAGPELRRIKLLIHDRTIQRLTALGWWAERVLGDEGTPVAAETKAIADELRELVLAAGQQRATAGPFGDGVRVILAEQRGRGGPSTHLMLREARPTADGSLVPDDVTSAAIDVAREAVGNAVRHSSATQVVVEACTGPGFLHFEVADDGVGIDREARHNSAARGHAGLRGMFTRASDVGARVELVTGERGTRITFDWRR